MSMNTNLFQFRSRNLQSNIHNRSPQKNSIIFFEELLTTLTKIVISMLVKPIVKQHKG
jgi:hypothetical protein